MGERVRFRPSRDPSQERGVTGLAAIFVVVGALLWLRAWWTPTAPEGLLVEVSGEVAAPGAYLVDPPTLAAAVEAAGGLVRGVPETALFPGDTVVVGLDGPRVVPGGNPLLVALPVDVNVHGIDALAAVPGLGASRAEAVIASRRTEGPFYQLKDLTRVSGIGADTVEALAPFLTVGDVGYEPPVDVNRASKEALMALPGIGPVLAGRIIEDRATRGPYASVDDLTRVSGVGERLLTSLRGRLVVEEP